MSNGNKTPAKSKTPKLAQNIKGKQAHQTTTENVKNRSYKGRVL